MNTQDKDNQGKTRSQSNDPESTPLQRARSKVEFAKTRLKQAEASLELSISRQDQRERKEDTRRKILIGGIMLKVFVKESQFRINILQEVIKENVAEKDLHLFSDILSLE